MATYNDRISIYPKLIKRKTERVSQSSSPPPIKTEVTRQTGPESRVTGRETPAPPAATRRWVPPSLIPHHELTPEAQNDATFRKVRGILNKLTPEKFQKLGDDLLKIDLSNYVILKGVIHLLFEKALDEPKYSSMYAQLCKRLSVEAPILTQADNSSEFLNLLLNVCRDRFLNRQSVNHYNHGLSNLYAEDEEKLHIAKQKMLGNVKFIGELYKLDMLQDSILHKCIQQLLLDKDRSNTIKDRCEDMECLSQLIRTCGKDLDSEQFSRLNAKYSNNMSQMDYDEDYEPKGRGTNDEVPKSDKKLRSRISQKYTDRNHSISSDEYDGLLQDKLAGSDILNVTKRRKTENTDESNSPESEISICTREVRTVTSVSTNKSDQMVQKQEIQSQHSQLKPSTSKAISPNFQKSIDTANVETDQIEEELEPIQSFEVSSSDTSLELNEASTENIRQIYMNDATTKISKINDELELKLKQIKEKFEMDMKHQLERLKQIKEKFEMDMKHQLEREELKARSEKIRVWNKFNSKCILKNIAPSKNESTQ